MHPKNLFYIVDFKDNQFNLYDAAYSPVQNKLNGIYAYVAYERNNAQSGGKKSVLLLKHFKNHESLHSSIKMLLDSTYKHSGHLSEISPPNITPNYGGEIVFFNGEVVCWNFKSKAFSQTTRQDSIVIKNEETIRALKLPYPAFLYAWESDNELSKVKLDKFFSPTGDFKPETIQAVESALDMKRKLEIKPDIRERMRRGMQNLSTISPSPTTGLKKNSDTGLRPFSIFNQKNVTHRRNTIATCSSSEKKYEDYLLVPPTVLSS